MLVEGNWTILGVVTNIMSCMYDVCHVSVFTSDCHYLANMGNSFDPSFLCALQSFCSILELVTRLTIKVLDVRDQFHLFLRVMIALFGNASCSYTVTG